MLFVRDLMDCFPLQFSAECLALLSPFTGKRASLDFLREYFLECVFTIYECHDS